MTARSEELHVQPAADERLTIGLYAGVAAATIVGGAVSNATPFMLAASMRQIGVNETQASWLLTAELVAFFVAATLASRTHRLPVAQLVVPACFIFAAGNGLSALTGAYDVMLTARLICGLAAGVAFSGSIRIAASHHQFARLFAVSIVGTTFFAALSLFIIGELLQDQWSSGVYLFYAVVGLVAAPLCLALRPGGRGAETVPTRLFTPVATGLVLVFLLSRLSDAAFWSFSERFGARAGFDTAQVGIILGISICVALGAPLLALKVKREAATAALFAAAVATKSMMPLLVLFAAGGVAFVMAQLVASFCFILLAQLMLSRFAELDGTGRLGTVGGLAGLAGEGVGPVLAGEAYGVASYGGVAHLSMASGFLALLLFGAMSVRSMRTARPC